MALLYDASGDLYSIASFTLPGNEGCFGGWVYPTDATSRQRIWSQVGSAVDTAMNFRGDLAGDPISAYRPGATYAECVAPAANFANYALNTWMFWLFAWDLTQSRLYIGNLTNPPAEPSAYTTQTTVVTPATGSGTGFIGNETTASARYFRGSIDRFFVYPSFPDLTTRYRLWRGYLVPGASYFGLPGWNGTTNVPDYSGNGFTGTITSLALTSSAPLPNPFELLFEGEEDVAYAVAAAPAGGQPLRKRHGGIPGMRVGGASFGGSWAA